MESNDKKIVLDQFCLRQFDVNKQSATQINYDATEFESQINKFYNEGSKLHDGYAPFCKHLFVPNFTKTALQIAEITSSNIHLLKTQYEARTEKELPVLRRYFHKNDLPQQQASHLDIILYSKDQIKIENTAMKTIDINKDIDYEWGVVSVKPQNCDYEIPMEPITMMRNALGVEEGGSGIPLEREKYLKSAQFWEKHAIIK